MCADICGIVVHVDRQRIALLREALERIAGVTVHTVSSEGKIVATIDTESEERSMELFERIRSLPEVLSLAMVYHQLETDPDLEV